MAGKRALPPSARPWQALLPWGIVVMGGWAYRNSFKVPFIFDDPEAIVKNSQIHSLWPLTHFLAPPHFEGLFSRSVVSLTLVLNYALGGLNEEAIAHYTVVLHLQPDSAEGHNNLGIALARQGKSEEAAHYFSRALELQEDYPDARHNLELIRKQQGQ